MTISTPTNNIAIVEIAHVEAVMRSLLDEQAKDIANAIYNRLHQPRTTDEGRYLTRKEAAKRLRVSLPTLQKRLNDGTIEFNRLGRRILIPASEIERFSN